MSEPLFDSQRFLQSLAGDDELARELLQAFMEDSPKRSVSLNEALAANDAGEVAKLAHSLKGMCGVVRSESLVNIALSMEHQANDNNLERVKEMYGSFAANLDLVHAEINQFLSA